MAERSAEANHMSDEFTQCIMFESDFHTPENASAEWNPDADYENYQWWLVRTDNRRMGIAFMGLLLKISNMIEEAYVWNDLKSC